MHTFYVTKSWIIFQETENMPAGCTIDYFKDNELAPEFDCYSDDDKDDFEGTPDKVLPPTVRLTSNDDPEIGPLVY